MYIYCGVHIIEVRDCLTQTCMQNIGLKAIMLDDMIWG